MAMTGEMPLRYSIPAVAMRGVADLTHDDQFELDINDETVIVDKLTFRPEGLAITGLVKDEAEPRPRVAFLTPVAEEPWFATKYRLDVNEIPSWVAVEYGAYQDVLHETLLGAVRALRTAAGRNGGYMEMEDDVP